MDSIETCKLCNCLLFLNRFKSYFRFKCWWMISSYFPCVLHILWILSCCTDSWVQYNMSIYSVDIRPHFHLPVTVPDPAKNAELSEIVHNALAKGFVTRLSPKEDYYE